VNYHLATPITTSDRGAIWNNGPKLSVSSEIYPTFSEHLAFKTRRDFETPKPGFPSGILVSFFIYDENSWFAYGRIVLVSPAGGKVRVHGGFWSGARRPGEITLTDFISTFYLLNFEVHTIPTICFWVIVPYRGWCSQQSFWVECALINSSVHGIIIYVGTPTAGKRRSTNYTMCDPDREDNSTSEIKHSIRIYAHYRFRARQARFSFFSSDIWRDILLATWLQVLTYANSDVSHPIIWILSIPSTVTEMLVRGKVMSEIERISWCQI
jgi:hypothetical protein